MIGELSELNIMLLLSDDYKVGLDGDNSKLHLKELTAPKRRLCPSVSRTSMYGAGGIGSLAIHHPTGILTVLIP